MIALTPRRVAAALRDACRFDVIAFKPGNVSLDAPGHDMSAFDFLKSAAVAADALAAPAGGLGERVLAAIAATRAAVGCNTNLGIVLLTAPLALAALRPSAGRDLRARLAVLLATTSVEDAQHVYRAIRLAAPAGLGASEDQDVRDEPTENLTRVMEIAAPRDSVARQYATVFDTVFERGLPALRTARERWGSMAWAAVACFVGFAAEIPDSHVVRKYGEARAAALITRFREVESAMKACENPADLLPALAALDGELKLGGVNPGTSADLTVASLAALFLETALQAEQS
jgi:triphosphoribosyl-dephospho-CoA synthase